MTEKNGPGQADKASAEKATAKVAADNKTTEDRERADSRQPRVGDGDVATPVDDTPARSDGAPERPAGLDPQVAPYPQYEDESLEALRALAGGRGVEVNRDVEKALLIKGLRDKDRSGGGVGPDRDDTAADRYPSYDFMPLEDLRKLADSRDVALDPETEKGHLVGELRAADSGSNTA